MQDLLINMQLATYRIYYVLHCLAELQLFPNETTQYFFKKV